jgi:hypothetical protein
MPKATSQAQRGFIYSQFGKDFAKRHSFDNKGKLPQYAKTSEVPKSKQEHPAKTPYKKK